MRTRARRVDAAAREAVRKNTRASTGSGVKPTAKVCVDHRRGASRAPGRSAAALEIMTTGSFPKEAASKRRLEAHVTVGGIAKVRE